MQLFIQLQKPLVLGVDTLWANAATQRLEIASLKTDRATATGSATTKEIAVQILRN